MKALTCNDFSLLVGIDWADRKHDICEHQPGSSDYEYKVISSRPADIDAWAISLKQRFPDSLIAISCELKKGPLIHALSKHKHLVLYPISPKTVARYRKAFSSSGAKNDPVDAYLQLEILKNHMDKLTPLVADKAEIRILEQLLEFRRTMVQERIAITNRITSLSKNYYPQLLDWFKEKDTTIFCNFVEKWPTLNAAKRVRKQTLLSFFNAHSSRYPAVNERRVEAIKSAHALTDDPGVIIACELKMKLLIAQLRQLIQSIEKLDHEIKSRYRQMEDKEIFSSFPAAGPQMAPRLLVAFGSNRDRYQSASDMQKYAGIAPVIEQSGKKSWTHWRYSCPKYLRQTFVEWAGMTMRYSFWAKCYYEQQIAKGKHHNTAVRSLAFKWIRIMYRCWKERKPYDEAAYLISLKERGSSLLKVMANA